MKVRPRSPDGSKSSRKGHVLLPDRWLDEISEMEPAKPTPFPADLGGLRFGRLVAQSRCGSDRHRHAKWLCKCDCGTYRAVARQNLIWGSVRSCGCLKKTTRVLDLAGQSFGQLVVIGQPEKRHSQRGIYWTCRCSCGYEKKIRADVLLAGHSKSCGIQSRHMEN